MLPISKELETLDMGCDFDIDKENIPSITLSISMVSSVCLETISMSIIKFTLYN